MINPDIQGILPIKLHQQKLIRLENTLNIFETNVTTPNSVNNKWTEIKNKTPSSRTGFLFSVKIYNLSAILQSYGIIAGVRCVSSKKSPLEYSCNGRNAHKPVVRSKFCNILQLPFPEPIEPDFVAGRLDVNKMLYAGVDGGHGYFSVLYWYFISAVFSKYDSL